MHRPPRWPRPCTLGAGALAAALLAGCATTAGPAAPAAAPRPAGAPPGAPAVPGQPQPFAAVVKDARQTEGLLTAWQKDDKVWLELRPEDFGKPFFLSPKIAQGIGEARLFGGTMPSQGRRVVEFRRVHNQVQLVARNTAFRAAPGTPAARAVEAGFSDSLVASSMVISQPHPQRKSVLVDAGALFLGDLQGIGATLQRTYRQGYALDARHTAFTAVRGKPDQLAFNVRAHYAAANLAVPAPGAPPGAPAPSTPEALPDPRSMFVGLYYALAALPAEPMRPRRADPRVGYFTTTVSDFSDDLARSPKQRYVNRWRLEKRDPAAALSEPVRPITFWLDKTVPVQYREAMTQGILAWNAAFEQIGLRDALVVKVQPDDADFDTLDVGVASVRWMTNAQPAFGAIGPSHVDPRSGEILDADIGFESLSSRGIRALRSQVLASRIAIDWPALLQAEPSEQRLARLLAGAHAGEYCEHADHAAEQLDYALDVLAARGDIAPDGPQAQAFVLEYLRGVTMHEVGHTLGLRHNFRASRAYTLAQLADPAFTAAHGIAGSVMEYPDYNLPPPGVPFARHGAVFRSALGPYDFWAIEYAYKPIAPEQEAAELRRIAARSAEPLLAYGTDEDQFLGIDPESLHFDLGDDPVAFARTRLTIARDLLARQERRVLGDGDEYSVLRRSVGYAVRDIGRAAGVLARQIGGVRTLRDAPGSGRDPLQPVPAALQRAALDTLAGGVLAADALPLSPALQRRLAPDFDERSDALRGGSAAVATDYSVAATVADLQRSLLGQLMSDGVAARLLDSADKDPQALRLSELHTRLVQVVWSELSTRGDIPAARRELQREHVNRLAGALLRPSGASRADTRSLLRAQAQALLPRLQAAGARGGLSAEARAHLADSADSLQQALAARPVRAGV